MVVMVAVADPATAANLGSAGARLAVRDGCSVLLFTALEMRASWAAGEQAFDRGSEQRLALDRAMAAVQNYDVPFRMEIGHRRLDWSPISRRRQIAEEIAKHASHAAADTIIVGAPKTAAIGRCLAQQLRRMTTAQLVEIPTDSTSHDSLAVVRRLWA